jgi:hypothetical protein
MKRLLAMVLVVGLGVALAEPVSVRVDFPEGLGAGKVPVAANVTGVQNAEVKVAVDPGNGYPVSEAMLENGRGELELQGLSRAALVTVKVEVGGTNYASTQAYDNQTSLEFVMNEPRSRTSNVVPLIGWAIGIVVLGLLALRGASAVF